MQLLSSCTAATKHLPVCSELAKADIFSQYSGGFAWNLQGLGCSVLDFSLKSPSSSALPLSNNADTWLIDSLTVSAVGLIPSFLHLTKTEVKVVRKFNGH